MNYGGQTFYMQQVAHINQTNSMAIKSNNNQQQRKPQFFGQNDHEYDGPWQEPPKPKKEEIKKEVVELFTDEELNADKRITSISY